MSGCEARSIGFRSTQIRSGMYRSRGTARSRRPNSAGRLPADSSSFTSVSALAIVTSRPHFPPYDRLSPCPGDRSACHRRELYECSMAELLYDCADFRYRDLSFRNLRNFSRIPALLSDVSSPRLCNETEHGTTDLAEFVSRLESVDVHELARMATAWADHTGDGISRRTLLLKLSAGLSIAALSPAEIDESSFPPHGQPVDPPSLSGTWRSRYVYSSTGRDADFIGDHYVIFRQQQNRLIGQSLPHPTGSRLRLDLVLEPPVATGSWRETTSRTGYYKGATYHGALQMIIDPSGRSMQGMWIGFSRDFKVNSGRWELALESNSTVKTK